MLKRMNPSIVNKTKRTVENRHQSSNNVVLDYKPILTAQASRQLSLEYTDKVAAGLKINCFDNLCTKQKLDLLTSPADKMIRITRIDKIRQSNNTIQRKVHSSLDRDSVGPRGRNDSLDQHEVSKVFDEQPYADGQASKFVSRRMSPGVSFINTPQQSNTFRFLIDEEPLCEGFEFLPEPMAATIKQSDLLEELSKGHNENRTPHNLPPMSKLMMHHLKQQ